MVVVARTRIASEARIAAGWWGEYFTRTKRIKPLEHYLKPLQPEARRKAAGIAKVLALFKRKFEKGKTDGAG